MIIILIVPFNRGERLEGLRLSLVKELQFY